MLGNLTAAAFVFSKKTILCVFAGFWLENTMLDLCRYHKNKVRVGKVVCIQFFQNTCLLFHETWVSAWVSLNQLSLVQWIHKSLPNFTFILRRFSQLQVLREYIKNEYAALKWNAAIEWLSLMFSKMRKKTERDMPKENIIVLILYWATVFKFNYLLSCFAKVMTQK